MSANRTALKSKTNLHNFHYYSSVRFVVKWKAILFLSALGFSSGFWSPVFKMELKMDNVKFLTNRFMFSNPRFDFKSLLQYTKKFNSRKAVKVS